MTESIRVPEREVSVIADADVAVIGGGNAGAIAAIAAARTGARTVLVERFADLGGVPTVGRCVHWSNTFVDSDLRRTIKGIASEALERLVAMGGTHASSVHAALAGEMKTPKFIMTDPQLFSLLLLEMNDEAGVQMLLGTYCTDVITADGDASEAGDPADPGREITAIIVENKQGSGAIRAKVFIDATGEGDIAFKAGAPCITDPAHQAIMTNFGLLARFGNVDMDQFLEAFMALSTEPDSGFTEWLSRYTGRSEADLRGDRYWSRFLDPLTAHGLPRPGSIFGDHPQFTSEAKKWYRDRWDRDGFFAYISMWLFRDAMRRAIDAGEFEIDRDIDDIGKIVFNFDGFSAGKYRNGEMVLNAVTPDKGIDAFDTHHTTRAEIAARKRVHELWQFFKKYIPGFQDSYIIDTGAYAIGRHPRIIDGGYMLTRDDLVNQRSFEDTIFINAYEPTPGIAHEVPYRMMVPRGVDNLLVAGRCAAGSIHVRPVPSTMAMGHAAGTAAALAAQRGEPVAGLDIPTLQATLREQDAILEMVGREKLG